MINLRMGSKFWRQLIFAEGVLLIGLGLGWGLAPVLGHWEWLPLTVVFATGGVLLGGVIIWQKNRRAASVVRKNFRLGQPLSFESTRKAIRAHGEQPDLVETPMLQARLIRVQAALALNLDSHTLVTLYNEGPEAVGLELEGESQLLEADHWLRIGPYAQAGTLILSSQNKTAASFVLMHSLLPSQGLD